MEIASEGTTATRTIYVLQSSLVITCLSNPAETSIPCQCHTLSTESDSWEFVMPTYLFTVTLGTEVTSASWLLKHVPWNTLTGMFLQSTHVDDDSTSRTNSPLSGVILQTRFQHKTKEKNSNAMRL